MKNVRSILITFLFAGLAAAHAQDTVAVLLYETQGAPTALAEEIREEVSSSLTAKGFSVIESEIVDQATRGLSVSAGKFDSSSAIALRDKIECSWVVVGRAFKAGDTTFILTKVLDTRSDWVRARPQQIVGSADPKPIIQAIGKDVIALIDEAKKG